MVTLSDMLVITFPRIGGGDPEAAKKLNVKIYFSPHRRG